MRRFLAALTALALTSGAFAGDDNCLWDNDLEPDGFNARAVSPPAFPDIRVADDFRITNRDAKGWTIRDLHVTVVEDIDWISSGRMEVTIYSSLGPNEGPGPAICQHVVPIERMRTGEELFDRPVYEYWAFFPPEKLFPRQYYVGHRDPGGAGVGTNYWATSSGGPLASETGWFTLTGGPPWQDEGPDWNHAFKITGSVNCNPCKGDIDGNCFVDFDDLLQVLSGWGPCPPGCDDPGVCPDFPPCDGQGCACFLTFEGGGDCLSLDTTCDAPECPNGSGDCPPGWTCYVETCCGVPTCAPPENLCRSGAAPKELPSGTATFSGVRE